jgi:hypothetical protein
VKFIVNFNYLDKLGKEFFHEILVRFYVKGPVEVNFYIVGQLAEVPILVQEHKLMAAYLSVKHFEASLKV